MWHHQQDQAGEGCQPQQWGGGPGWRWHRRPFGFGWHGGFQGSPEGQGPEPWEGRPGGRGDRMERGLLRYVLLDTLSDGPKHGYEIIKSLEERTHGFYVPSPGTVYPTLQLLEDQGLVRADQAAERRVYTLTDAGHAELDTHAEAVRDFWSRFPGQTPSGGGRHEIGFLFEELDGLIRTVRGSLRPLLWNSDIDTVRRIRQALERCQNEIREIIAGSSTGQE